MKKLLLLLLVFPFIAVSCSDDDDDKGYKNKDIAGTWDLTDVVPKTVLIAGEGREEVKTIIEEDIYGKNKNETYIFSENGIITIKENGTVTDSGLFYFNGKKINLATHFLKGDHDIVITANTFTLAIDETLLYRDNIELLEDFPEVTIQQVVVEYIYTKR